MFKLRRLGNKIKLTIRKIKTAVSGKRRKGEYAYPENTWNSLRTTLPENRCTSYSFTKWYKEFNVELLIKYKPFNY